MNKLVTGTLMVCALVLSLGYAENAKADSKAATASEMSREEEITWEVISRQQKWLAEHPNATFEEYEKADDKIRAELGDKPYRAPAGIGQCAVMEFESVQGKNGYGETKWSSVRVLRNNCNYTVEFDVGGQFGGRFVRVNPGMGYQPGSEENWSGVVRRAKK